MRKNNCIENSPTLWSNHLPKLDKNANKYTRGHAMIFGGYPITGAARLAARAAARIGAGLVTITVPQKAFSIYASSLLSIMVKSFSTLKEFNTLLKEPRISAYLIGPGAGVAGLQPRVLALLKTQKPIVLDADALTAFQKDPQRLFTHIQGPCVLTPHEGEFSRLFNLTGERIQRAYEAAKQSKAIIVLKGTETIITAPDGRMVINKNAPPTLATAGSGDVLSGIITGLVAQSMDPFLASCAAVFLHAEAANLFGKGLIAEDLPDLLPRVLF